MSDIFIEGEKAYPIYSFESTWYQDGVSGYPECSKGLPGGKIWNFTSFRKMYREEVDKRELQKFMIDWWDNYVNQELSTKNASTPILEVKLLEYETWYLRWFEHQTFDTGQSNAEVLQSFEKFVRRKQKLGDKVYCLMGAEDRWRWHSVDGGVPPCRCEHCKTLGVLRISH